MTNIDKTPPAGYKEVFCKYIKLKDGTIRYPKKSKYFRFFVPIDRQRA